MEKLNLSVATFPPSPPASFTLLPLCPWWPPITTSPRHYHRPIVPDTLLVFRLQRLRSGIYYTCKRSYAITVRCGRYIASWKQCGQASQNPPAVRSFARMDEAITEGVIAAVAGRAECVVAAIMFIANTAEVGTAPFVRHLVGVVGDAGAAIGSFGIPIAGLGEPAGASDVSVSS
jgi:hypothetical protein